MLACSLARLGHKRYPVAAGLLAVSAFCCLPSNLFQTYEGVYIVCSLLLCYLYTSKYTRAVECNRIVIVSETGHTGVAQTFEDAHAVRRCLSSLCFGVQRVVYAKSTDALSHGNTVGFHGFPWESRRILFWLCSVKMCDKLTDVLSHEYAVGLHGFP